MDTKLSPAQVKALHKFAQAGGHGYGEYSGLPKTTARVLGSLGLVRFGWVRIGSGKSMAIGLATEAGQTLLASLSGTTVRPVWPDPYSFTAAPVGWLPGRAKKDPA